MCGRTECETYGVKQVCKVVCVIIMQQESKVGIILQTVVIDGAETLLFVIT